ncbi:MAG TPA: ATP-binding protein [Woeseiaceae bacterium]|nr:ATP-binding protein [Woeseiaceae bacterium]
MGRSRSAACARDQNPLTPIQLSAERLRRKYLHTMSSDEAQILDRATHTIVQQVEAMKEMVNAFSDYARAPDIDISPFSIEKLAHEVVDLYRVQESGIEVQVHTASDLPTVAADVGRIRQILHNLIRNSIEALETTGARLHGVGNTGHIDVSVSATKLAGIDVVEIEVADNGPGFQAGSISQIFDPYVTTKPRGTGLGLAIVKKLVEEHAGTIEAENREQGGAVIRIRLPVNEAAREAMSAMLPRRTERRRERA